MSKEEHVAMLSRITVKVPFPFSQVHVEMNPQQLVPAQCTIFQSYFTVIEGMVICRRAFCYILCILNIVRVCAVAERKPSQK